MPLGQQRLQITRPKLHLQPIGHQHARPCLLLLDLLAHWRIRQIVKQLRRFVLHRAPAFASAPHRYITSEPPRRIQDAEVFSQALSGGLARHKRRGESRNRVRDDTRGRDPINGRLITNLPVSTRAQANEKLQWYALRWRIELFHKILKSGCQAEHSKLRTAERLVNLLATFCILSWRIFWLTMSNRSTQKTKASIAFTPLEIGILNRHAPNNTPTSARSPTLKSCLTRLARIGGNLNRGGDGPPGNIVMWRGMSRLTDIELGFPMAMENCG
ncbi:MAG: transposase [Burkholderiales bacterium]